MIGRRQQSNGTEVPMAEEEKAAEPAAPRPPLGAEPRLAPRFAPTLSITRYPAGGGLGAPRPARGREGERVREGDGGGRRRSLAGGDRPRRGTAGRRGRPPGRRPRGPRHAPAGRLLPRWVYPRRPAHRRRGASAGPLSAGRTPTHE